MSRGTVKWWHESRGYGFITGDDGKEYFVHYSEIAGKGRRNLIPYANVEFEPERNAKGLKATKVKPVRIL